MLLLVQAIARACYSDAQVFLMDDPLSAVDPEVANHIFQRVFKGLLRGKTRVLVSHALSFAPQVRICARFYAHAHVFMRMSRTP